MPFAAVAASAAGALVTAGVGALTSKKQSGAVQGGADAANALSEKTIQEARDSSARDRAVYQPYVDYGGTGLGRYSDLLGINGADAATAARQGFQASPGYQYQLEQGLRAVDAGAASRGMLRSGATIKAEQTLGANLANQDFGNYLGRLNNLAGVGLQAAGGQADTTRTFNALLGSQSSGQQQTTVGAAQNQASIYGNTGQQIGDALGGAVKNGLYAYANGGFGGGGGGYTSAFDGAGIGF